MRPSRLRPWRRADVTRGIRVGVLAHQESTSTNVEIADITLIIDWDLRS